MCIRDRAKDLPVEKYDLIINDFEHITSRSCQIKKIPSVQFGHQASFFSKNTPRPSSRSFVGEFLLQNYAPASKYVGLHFDAYDDFIFSPIIKKEFLEAKPEDHGYLTVYLPAYDHDCIEKILLELTPLKVHWFVPNISEPFTKNNITFFPVDQKYFNKSLIYCHALLTGGGFETPAEALFLKKKLLVIPIEGQYEQQCNAAALEKVGVKKMAYLNESTKQEFFNWLKMPPSTFSLLPNHIPKTLEYMMG